MPATGGAPAGQHPQRLGDEGRAEDPFELAEVVGEDVGVVHPHVEGDRAGLADGGARG